MAFGATEYSDAGLKKWSGDLGPNRPAIIRRIYAIMQLSRESPRQLNLGAPATGNLPAHGMIR